MKRTKANVGRSEYLSDVLGESTDRVSRDKALDTVLDIRKFEIELYWKRASYFWAFIAFALAGYFALASSNDRTFELELLISCVGLVFSVAWYFVNRGSKNWQRNWETHLDLLEDEVTGPLYKTMLNRYRGRFWRLTGPYHFSPTRINHLLNLFLIVMWFGLVVQSGLVIFRQGFSLWPAVYILTALMFVCFLSRWGKTEEDDIERSVDIDQRVYKR